MYFCGYMKKVRPKNSPKSPSPRSHKVTFMLNDEEQKAVTRYLERYKISNKSRWYRETIMTHILKIMEEDYPTLFNENEMRR
ncbi:hypothetical protein M2480_000221 [Parabacteroides sp. PFB2-12]|nr:hypothetical protein [Parabacteroides sp. PM6-13]MDH6389263.1 hypothetical protein [Parabacteroides sp. PFB2-12]